MFNKDQLNQLYRYALSLSRHEETAYDLVQSAIERYLQKKPAEVERPMAYLKTVIRNLYFDLQRHNKVIPMESIDSEELAHIEPLEDDSMESCFIHPQQVQQLLVGLNTEENELLYLWAVEENTVEEIAGIFEKPKGTILSKLHRLKKRIRNQFQGGSVAANE